MREIGNFFDAELSPVVNHRVLPILLILQSLIAHPLNFINIAHKVRQKPCKYWGHASIGQVLGTDHVFHRSSYPPDSGCALGKAP